MDLFELSATLGLDTGGFSTGVKGAMNMLTGLSDFAQEKFAWLADVAFDFGKDVIDTGLGFDKAMGSVQAVLGREEGTAENMARLRQFAMEQARQSIFTTEEAADAYYYMGMAGWKTEQMLGGLPGIMALAAASGEDLALVSDIVTDSMTAFGWGADRASEYADILAATVTNSNTDVEQLGTAFKYAAPIAGNFGLDVKDIAVSLGLMASQGIKGSQAGTTLRSIMQRLAADTNDARGTLERLGVAVFDENGKMRDWSDIIDDTRKAFAGLSDEEKANIAYTVAGKTGMSGFLALINATETDVNNLTTALEESEGAAQWMSETRLDNLSGDLEYFNSELNVLKTSLFDNVKDPLRDVVQEGTEGLHRITDAIQEGGIIGGLKQLSEELRNLKENETFKEFLKSAGEVGGEILGIITSDLLPGLDDTVVSLGHSFASGLFSGIEDSIREKHPMLAGLFGLGAHWFGTDVSNGVGSYTGTNPMSVPEVVAEKMTINGVEVSREDIQKALDESGGQYVTIAGVEMNKDWAYDMLAEFDQVGNEGGEQIAQNVNSKIETAAPGIASILGAFIGGSGTSAGSAFSTLFSNVINTDAPGIRNDLSNTIGNAGTSAGNDIVAGIRSVLSFAQFTVSIAGVISGIFNTNHNASAMSSGRIYNRSTVFGYYDNAYQVAGDGGSEAVVGVNSLQRMITNAVHSANAGSEVFVPREAQSRPVTVIMQVGEKEFGRLAFELGSAEEQRVGVKLAKGGAY